MILQMDSSLEIRKLPPSYVRELVQIIEYAESWKRLMSIIPKVLERNTYACDIKIDNLPKYNSEHFKIIENASIKYKRACTEILFDEWGTSGKVRPALGHLLYLLTKAELFRAADYVAVEVLSQTPPSRPKTGPAALITTSLPDLPPEPKEAEKNLEEIEKLLDQIAYPRFAQELIRKNSNEATSNSPASNVIPDIVISESPDVEERQTIEFGPVVVQREKQKANCNEVSDMIKFSSTSVTGTEEQHDMVPQLSQLLGGSEDNIKSYQGNSSESASSSLSNISNANTDEDGFSKTVSQENIPQFSRLLENNSQNDSANVPVLSALNQEGSAYSERDLPNLSEFHSQTNTESSEINSGVMPDFEALQATSEVGLVPISSKSSTISTSTQLLPTVCGSTSNSSNTSTKCSSPLPKNLSLNTLLPHFMYRELQMATNNFSSQPYKSEDEPGRFLGSGAFGSVFLAIGLFDRPIAVKKLFLDNVEEVNLDDKVTKQFRNEVEVLSKYKHPSLLSLLGYSCDGCTYCLLYEYVPGGALKDRLLATENKLQWKERLNIALGTSQAVSYLHTAFATPLIHRDIKSANILLDSSNNAKLCDFGLITLLPSQNTNTQTAVSGTSAYMSPEAHRGDISVKQDTFSFGVVVLELLTSLPPLDPNREGCDLVTHVEDNCTEDINPLLDRSAGTWIENDVNFAQELFQITLKCLEEKRKRPEMVEVNQHLDKLIKKLD